MLLKFNESSKFEEVKNILNDLEGIMVELYDNHIDIDIYPSIETTKKLMVINNLKYSGFFNIKIKNLDSKVKFYHLITETIHMINDYMSIKGYDTKILVTESIDVRYSRQKKRHTSERYVTLQELSNIYQMNSIEISFKEQSKIEESSKFEEVKNILNDLEGIMVELYDNHIDIDIEPSNEIRMKLVSLNELEYEGFYITFKHLSEKRKHYHLITETIHMIIDYMDLKGFDTQILILDNNSRYKGLGNREKVVTIEELSLFSLGFTDSINYIEISFSKKKRNSHLNESIQTKKEETFNTLNSIADTIRADEGCRITFQHLSTLIIHPSRKVDYKITEQLVDSIHTIVDYARYRGYKSDILCNISGIVSGFNITNDIDKLLDKPFTKYSDHHRRTIRPQIRIDFRLEDPNQIKMDLTNENMNLELSKDIINTLNGVCDTIQYDEVCNVLKGYLWKHPTNIENKYKIRISSSDKSGYTITRNLLDSIHTIVDYMNYKGYESKVLTDISGDEWRMLPYMEDITNNIDNLLNMPFRNAPTVITIEFILKKTNEILSFKNFIYKL